MDAALERLSIELTGASFSKCTTISSPNVTLDAFFRVYAPTCWSSQLFECCRRLGRSSCCPGNPPAGRKRASVACESCESCGDVTNESDAVMCAVDDVDVRAMAIGDGVPRFESASGIARSVSDDDRRITIVGALIKREADLRVCCASRACSWVSPLAEGADRARSIRVVDTRTWGIVATSCCCSCLFSSD
jgi:hypothetical protein